MLQADLDKALPALDEAVSSLKSLSKSDIVEIKSLSNPPPGVKMVMDATCVMFDLKVRTRHATLRVCSRESRFYPHAERASACIQHHGYVIASAVTLAHERLRNPIRRSTYTHQHREMRVCLQGEEGARSERRRSGDQDHGTTGTTRSASSTTPASSSPA